MTMFHERKRAAGRGGVMLAAALALSGCTDGKGVDVEPPMAVVQGILKSPVVRGAAADVTCEAGKIGLAAVPYASMWTQAILAAFCDQTKSWLKVASGRTYTSPEAKARAELGVARFDTEAAQAEYERVLEALRIKGVE